MYFFMVQMIIIWLEKSNEKDRRITHYSVLTDVQTCYLLLTLTLLTCYCCCYLFVYQMSYIYKMLEMPLCIVFIISLDNETFQKKYRASSISEPIPFKKCLVDVAKALNVLFDFLLPVLSAINTSPMSRQREACPCVG